MKTKLIITIIAVFAVLAVTGGRAFAREIEIRNGSRLASGQPAATSTITIFSQVKEDRSLFEQKIDDKFVEDNRQLISEVENEAMENELEDSDMDDRGLSSSVSSDDLSSLDKSSSTFIGTVPQISSSPDLSIDDHGGLSHEAESQSSISKSDDRSSSHDDSGRIETVHAEDSNDR